MRNTVPAYQVRDEHGSDSTSTRRTRSRFNKYARNTTHQVREVRDPRQTLVDDELEGDGSEDERERQLKTVLRKTTIDGEGGEREARYEELQHGRSLRQTVEYNNYLSTKNV